VEQGALGTESFSEDRRGAERLFHRDLPGGGFVAIELTSASPPTDRVVRVIVERRGDRGRRNGHRPPIILEENWKPERGLSELYRIVSDNAAIARGLLALTRVD
jgi:hypothetical protein